MKTKEQIILSMCLTYRHDFGLMSDIEQASLIKTMTQIFDNSIDPYMEFKKDPLDYYWQHAGQFSE